MKITPNDLKTEAQRLIAANQMPALPDLLKAVAKVRTKYKPLIEKEKENANNE